ncbi:hypothetical protein DYB37_008100 [Aphanomyces astaci]|uniref:Uncharacterized protein n=2 Tax=Aphanomyces astaci TaxID=112090 RepID=A0A3R6WTD1_APHAT|nr:hypothetical protein DYB35_006902 [Aphanomyces astaci]RHZ33943.1 hypothetical protein DYB37_008100 [Aphanomyces astaci]
MPYTFESKMKWATVAVVALLAMASPSVDGMKCKKLVHTCLNGVTKVYPNPDNNCKFDLCPEDMEDDDVVAQVEGTVAPTTAVTAVLNKSQAKHIAQDEWIALDDAAVPTSLRDAAKLAFDLYTEPSVCDELKIEYSSVELKNASDFIGTKNKDSKYNKVATQSYHVVATVTCTLDGKDQVPGNFVLNMEHHGNKDSVKYFQLVECGHEEQWGQMVNWLTIRNGRAYCQTREGKAKFDAQPLHFINAEASQSDPNSILSVIKKDNKYIAITGALVGLLGVVLIALVLAVVTGRRTSRTARKWAKQRTPAKPKVRSVLEDDATTIENEVHSTRGLIDGVSTKSSMDEIKI